MYRVVIADDEPLIRKGLRETVDWDILDLEISGDASNGSEALELIKKVRPQILITDIKMPVMGGLELIKTLRNNNIRLRIIILSGYSDYEYLKEAIKYDVESYLLKPIDNDELKSILICTVNSIEKEMFMEMQQREGLQTLRTNTLNRLVTNNIGINEFNEKSAFLNMNFNNGEFLVLIITIDKREVEGGLGQDEHLETFAIYNICNEIVSSKELGIAFVNYKGFVVLIMNSTNDFLAYDYIDSFVKELSAPILEYLQVSIIVGVGAKVNSVEEIYISYNSALESLNYGVVTKNKNAVFYSDISPKRHNSDISIKIDLPHIDNIIKLGKKEEISEYIEKIFIDLADNESINLKDIQNIVMQIIIYIINIISYLTGKDTAGVVDKLSFNYTKLLNVKKMNDFKLLLKEFCYEAMDLLPKNYQQNISKAVKDTVNYITLHYCDDLSLKSIANSIFINASYLGQIFKKEIGESFTEYVNKIRVQKAKELLTNTNLKVYEIAEKVGFTDYSYFIKMFKKYMHVNPSDIKK